MRINFIIVSFLIFSMTNIELKGCQCSGNGEIDMMEYILADIIAEVEVKSFEQNIETNKSKTIVKVIKNYKPKINLADTLIFASNYGGCSYSLVSGKYIVWANKDKNGNYRISTCSRFIRLYDKKNLKRYISNINKYKSEHRKMVRFLKKYRNKTGFLELFQDNKIISGYLEKGTPIGSWQVIDKKLLSVHQFLFKNGLKNGIQVAYRLDNPKVRSFASYQDGELEGISQSTFVNGVPNMISTFRNGVENGIKYYYHMNGKLRIKGNMVNGVEEGLWQYFDEDGKIEKEIIYELIKGKTPQRDLRIDNYSRREYHDYDKDGNIIKRIVYKNREKIIEQYFTKKDNVQH